jgi:aminoglycoside N3'-acetyltransferase
MADGRIRGMDGVRQSPATLATDLRALGLMRGSLVMVHASLRAIGPVESGADGVIDAIRDVLGEAGTMMMVLGAHDDRAWVNQRPEVERVGLLAGADPFDAQVTPADREVGALAEVFRQRPETLVSEHPEGRFAAAGPLAPSLLSDVPWHDYFGPGSPLQRLLSHEGKVLRLGADTDTVTALHYAEYRSSVEPKKRVRRHRLVTTTDGPHVRVVDSLDDDLGIVEYDGDYFADILRDYLATGRASRGTVGRASSELLDGADAVAYGVRWMDEKLAGASGEGTAAALTARLDDDLLDARRRRDAPRVAALRALKSALANAEAVPVGERPYELVEGSADVPRRALTPFDVSAIVNAEIAERRRALDEYRGLGLDTTSLEAELSTLERYRRSA